MVDTSMTTPPQMTPGQCEQAANRFVRENVNELELATDGQAEQLTKHAIDPNYKAPKGGYETVTKSGNQQTASSSIDPRGPFIYQVEVKAKAGRVTEARVDVQHVNGGQCSEQFKGVAKHLSTKLTRAAQDAAKRTEQEMKGKAQKNAAPKTTPSIAPQPFIDQPNQTQNI